MADLVTLAETKATLNLGADTTHDTELSLYISAVTAHVEERYGVLPSDTYTEIALTVDQGDGVVRLLPTRWPVLTVTSIADVSNTYSTDFTITADGLVAHDSLTHGRWTIVYSAGYATMPADLKLAALEDIRGLFQPAQIGPPAQFGAFGIDSVEVGAGYRPVRMWPRVDAWIENRTLPGVA